MAQQNPPRVLAAFNGVYTSGNPLFRPQSTAQVCENFRVMPGSWLRLRGGRKARYNVGNGIVKKIHPINDLSLVGSTQHLAQIKNDAGGVKWNWVASSNFGLAPSEILNINQSNDGNYTRDNVAAICNIEDRPVFYNGDGKRDGAMSRPGLSSYYGGVVRYFGLDAYAPGGRPSVAFAAGAGVNKIGVGGTIKIYVGLYAQQSEHYSNGVYAGSVSAPVDATDVTTGAISVSNVGNLLPVNHGSGDLAELKYVFYATVEGGQVPYLILNSSMTGPLTAAIGSGGASLAIASGTTNGWVLDLAHEMPTENYPPRRMRWISYVGGRMYGALLPAPGTGGTVVADSFERPFDYSSSAREAAGMVWSMAAGDVTDRDLLGDPRQCWPPRNFVATPNGEAPLWHGASPDDQSVLVLTPTAAFLLTELGNGVHSWFRLPGTSGVGKPETVVRTNYGVCWIDQQNQLVILENSSTSIRILSSDYQYLISGANPTAADYILDPLNLIDRYQVWFADGRAVCHDFLTGAAYSMTGQAEADGTPFTAASLVRDEFGKRHHAVAGRGFYTHEAQTEDGLIPTSDQTFIGTTQTFTTTYPTGRYRTNWDILGTLIDKKTEPYVDLCCDMVAAFACKWWVDFSETTDPNSKAVEVVQPSKMLGVQQTRRIKLAPAQWSAIKMEFRLTGHAGRATYTPLAQEGDLGQNFYGSILLAEQTVAKQWTR
jgi:hypothetical protein